MEDAELRRFLLEMEEQLEDREEDGGEPASRPGEMSRIYLDYLEDEGITSEAVFCMHSDETGRRRCAITAVAIGEDGTNADLFLGEYRAPHHGAAQSISNAELADLAGRAARFFDYAAKEDWARFAESPETLDTARRLRSAHPTLSSVRVFILTNCIAKDRDIEGLVVAERNVTFEVVDIARLFRLAGSATSRQDIVIDFKALTGRPLPCLEMAPRADEYDTYLAIFSGKLLFDLYERYGARLFEFNIRSFLQAKGKVNKGIRDTLRDTPDRFMAYNNGLVATADDIEVHLQDGAHVITRMVGLQIVNGAQTTASIFRAKKVDKIQLERVSVAVKLTRVAPERLTEFVPLISRFANTQNVVQVADLSANNDFHIDLERLSEQVWCPGQSTRWFYERARGSYEQAMQRDGTTAAKKRDFKQKTPPSMRISKTDVARYLVAWLGRPHTVSLGAQKNFAVFMAELPDMFPTNWKPDATFYKQCIAKAILYRTCERVVRIEKFAAYRANIAAYLYASLAHKVSGELDLERIWSEQKVSDSLFEALRAWSHVVDGAIRQSAGAKNITEWCKKPECWEAVRGEHFVLPATLPELVKAPDLGAHHEPTTSSPAIDEDLVEECMRYDAATWAKLNFWGVSTQSLDYFERGVAHTLSEYAASDWSRKPSPKQARIGARVLRRARDENLVS